MSERKDDCYCWYKYKVEVNSERMENLCLAQELFEDIALWFCYLEAEQEFMVKNPNVQLVSIDTTEQVLCLKGLRRSQKTDLQRTSGHGCQGTYLPVQVPFANVVGDANIVAELVTC